MLGRRMMLPRRNNHAINFNLTVVDLLQPSDT